MATLQKPPADGGEGGCGAVCCAGEDLNSCAVRDTCEAGHTTTHAGGAEVVNMLCWCRVVAGTQGYSLQTCSLLGTMITGTLVTFVWL